MAAWSDVCLGFSPFSSFTGLSFHFSEAGKSVQNVTNQGTREPKPGNLYSSITFTETYESHVKAEAQPSAQGSNLYTS